MTLFSTKLSRACADIPAFFIDIFVTVAALARIGLNCSS